MLGSGPLDYLRLTDDDREVAREVLARALKLHHAMTRYQAYVTAKFTWEGKPPDEPADE